MPLPAAPIVAPAAPRLPGGLAAPGSLPAVAAPRLTAAAPVVVDVPRLAGAPGRLASVETAMAAVADLVAGPGSTQPELRFAAADNPLPGAVQAALVLPGDRNGPPAVAFALFEPPAPPAPAAVAKRTRTRAAPEPQPAPAPAATEPVAAAPPAAPAPDPAGRNRLERAVETMLRNRIFGN